MTSVPIRHTPFASWKDSDAWMESMNGEKWAEILKEEASLVKKQLQNPTVQGRIGVFTANLRIANTESEIIPFECDSIFIIWHSQFMKTWYFKNSKQYHEARDVICKHGYVWTTKDVGNGSEEFHLECWKDDVLIWKKGPVGPDIGIKGKKLYYLGVKNKLIYQELWEIDSETGKGPKLVYTEKNPEVNLSLEKQPDDRLLLVQDHSQETKFTEITNSGELKKQTNRFIIPKNWKMPRGEYGIEFVWPRLNICITKRHGMKILWKCNSSNPPDPLLQIPAGKIQIDPFSAHLGNEDCLIHVSAPAQNSAYYKLKNLSLVRPIYPTGLVSKRYMGISKDGTSVYGILTYNSSSTPKYLIMIGYGAYGLETGISNVMKRWAPLVLRDWAIGYTFLRGGGDHTEEWGKIGRRSGRDKTIEDFIALIKSAQKILQISSKNTVIYGRSAGGLLMGSVLSNVPNGSLMSAVYTEVPYVDILRTTTNKNLPLTVLEYNEFGNPKERLEDFIYVGLTSPADSATVIASPEIFVLTRTAENDSQVFAYESVKWIRRLRSHDSKYDAPKLCIVEKNQGHFTPPEKIDQQWAVDCALLDAWIHDGLR